MKAGFFNMDDVNHVITLPNVAAAKVYANERVDAMPKATSENIRTARRDIEKARNVAELASTLTNYVLAHPSEGLKVIR